jgi:hypothetical protein
MKGGGAGIGANQSVIDRAKDMMLKAEEKKPIGAPTPKSPDGN